MQLALYKIWIFMRSLFRPRIHSFGERITHQYRVSLFDLDEYFHMNNARYLTYMELGRFDLVIRSGFFRYALKNKIMAPVVNTTIIYRRSLQPFQKFSVSNQLVYWDETSMYVESVVMSRGKLYTLAIKEIRVVQNGNAVPLNRIIQGMGIDLPELHYPEILIQDKKKLVKDLLQYAETKYSNGNNP